MLAVFFPKDREMIRMGWECHPKPETRLAQQPKENRFSKTRANYQIRSKTIQGEWRRIAEELTEANRFQKEFLAAANYVSLSQSADKGA